MRPCPATEMHHKPTLDPLQIADIQRASAATTEADPCRTFPRSACCVWYRRLTARGVKGVEVAVPELSGRDQISVKVVMLGGISHASITSFKK